MFFKKPDLVRLDSKDENGKRSQIWIIKGNRIRMYDLKDPNEGVTVTELDGSADQILFSTFFLFTRWMFTALPFDETEKYFHFHLNGEDKYWAYVQLKPRNRRQPPYLVEDEYEIVLNQKTHLPRQLRWRSGSIRTTLDFDKLEINPTSPITWESISKDLPKTFKRKPL